MKDYFDYYDYGLKVCPCCGKTEFDTSGRVCLRCGWVNEIKYIFPDIKDE